MPIVAISMSDADLELLEFLLNNKATRLQIEAANLSAIKNNMDTVVDIIYNKWKETQNE